MFSAKNFFLAGAAGYSVANSLRFRASNSANLTRTFSTPTSSTIWTFSTLVKRGSLGAARHLLGASTTTFFGFNSSDQLTLSLNGSTAFTSTAVFRDPTAWMHVVYQQNGAAQTCWVNNVSVASGTTAAAIFNTAIAHTLGASNATNFFDGLMSNVTFVDGQALTPSAFGQTDTSSGQWVPKSYTGTYGTNGFFLEFKDASAATAAAIGKDTSGNGNNWTPSGISVTAGVTFDQMTDTPSNNFCTLSPIYTDGAGAISGANLNFNGLGLNYNIGSTQGVSSGKWYWEYTGAVGQLVGVFLHGGAITSTTGALSYFSDGNKYTGSTPSAYGATWTGADIIGVALDMDAGTLTFYKNNISQGTAFSSLSGTYFPWFRTSTSATGSVNFGQRPFAYTPPTGFVALNTQNLTAVTINNGAQYMAATLYTGTAATLPVSNAVNGVGFQPDFVWFKSRSGAYNHLEVDSIRGLDKYLYPNLTNAEGTFQVLDSVNSSGFVVNASIGTPANDSGSTYVAWQWKEDVTPGFDIVTYTGNATNRTINHALGAVPHFMIIKNRSAVADWAVYHRNQNATPAAGSTFLNTTAAYAAGATIFNSTTPTSSVFSVGTASSTNGNTNNLVAYLWTSIPGFSLFDSYTGNGSADGTVVWCGFKPRWVMMKRVDTTGDWYIWDGVRIIPFNGDAGLLYTNSALAESDYNAAGIDFLAGGFKLRNTDSSDNASGGTYIFAAFAEAPFKFATAR